MVLLWCCFCYRFIVCHVKNSYNVHRYALGLRSDIIGNNDVSVIRQRFEWLRIVVGSCS